MTTITVYKSGESYNGFQCMGHAGYAEYNQDIVCASVSVLVINTINSIEAFTKDAPLTEADEKSGTIRCHFSKPVSRETALLIDAMLLGLSEIKKQYGKNYVDLKFEEV